MALHVKDAGVWLPVPDLWVKTGGVWTPVRRAFVKNAGAWAQYFQDELVVVLGDAASIWLVNYFTPEQWSDPHLKKRVVIPEGIEIGATDQFFAIKTNNSGSEQWRGDLIIENHGTISGAGRTPGSTGGHAINVTTLGLDGQKLIVNNMPTGIIRAGGGAGGRGGDGGSGSYGYTYTEGPYTNTSYRWEVDTPEMDHFAVYWGSLVASGSNGTATAVAAGGWTYYRGAFYSGSVGLSYYRVSRSQPRTASSSGGAGGNGGRGQGFDGSAAAGANGAAGGTNAGTGGKGGTGGGWGEPGATGSKGSNGNVGSGLAGAAGSLAGGYIRGSENVIFNNSGTVLGRFL